MDAFIVAQKARQPTLDEYFFAIPAPETQKSQGIKYSALNDEEDLRRFFRGGLAAK